MEYELYDGYYDGYFEYDGDGFDNLDLIAQIHSANDWITPGRWNMWKCRYCLYHVAQYERGHSLVCVCGGYGHR